MNLPPTICLFCGQPGNMSKQHVFADRLKHVLGRPTGTRRFGVREQIHTRGRKVRNGEAFKSQPGSLSSSKVRRVCKTCNQGWLNTMEQECIPIIERLVEGNLSVISKPDQIKLAKAATSMAMVGEWMHDSHAHTPRHERTLFKETLHPPPGWFVFIGRNGQLFADAAFFSDGGIASAKPHLIGEKVYITFTMVIGPVLLHVLTIDPSVILDPDGYAEDLGLAPICPTTDWINFAIMPTLYAAEIARIRAYAREAFRKIGHGF